jgi:hypothetical protein
MKLARCNAIHCRAPGSCGALNRRAKLLDDFLGKEFSPDLVRTRAGRRNPSLFAELKGADDATCLSPDNWDTEDVSDAAVTDLDIQTEFPFADSARLYQDLDANINVLHASTTVRNGEALADKVARRLIILCVHSGPGQDFNGACLPAAPGIAAVDNQLDPDPSFGKNLARGRDEVYTGQREDRERRQEHRFHDWTLVFMTGLSCKREESGRFLPRPGGG